MDSHTSSDPSMSMGRTYSVSGIRRREGKDLPDARFFFLHGKFLPEHHGGSLDELFWQRKTLGLQWEPWLFLKNKPWLESVFCSRG
jgi:hypothetical protein